jgi:hypothetical protein
MAIENCGLPSGPRAIAGSWISYLLYLYISTISIYTFFSTTISTEYFKHAAHSQLFSSKCRLFHNATFFGFCIIYILHTGCAKF